MAVPANGVVFRPTSAPERLRDVVEHAEAVGVDQLWLWEDCFAEGGLTSAAAALAWSRRLAVGVGLLPVGLRNPGLLAMEIATVARLFPHRFLPGLGHGAPDQLHSAGLRVESPLTLLREHAVTVGELLHGQRVDASLRYTRLDGATLDWPPTPPPPLLIGARGPRTLRLAGEIADGVILDSATTPDELRAALAQTDAGRAAAGRHDRFEVVVYVEPPPDLAPDELAAVVAGAVHDLGDAGATSVVFVNHPRLPDPGALLAALAVLIQA